MKPDVKLGSLPYHNKNRHVMPSGLTCFIHRMYIVCHLINPI